MRSGSIRFRLLFLATATIAIALALTWIVLSVLFEKHVKARVDVELANQIVWIAANLSVDGDTFALAADPPDPRYLLPLGGYYWQIDTDDEKPIRSRSLWDEVLPAGPEQPDGPVSYQANGPQGQRLFIRQEALRIAGADGRDHSIGVKVAADYGEVAMPLASFRRDMTVALIIIGLCLTGAAALQVSVGLAPLAAVRRTIADIRAGHRSRLDASVPREVRPLVEEINGFLAAQEGALSRARAGASDLAHALKTPLAVLSSVARTLVRSGMTESASEVAAQVDTVSRRVDRQLALARLNPDGFATTMLGTLVGRLANLMRRTPQGEALAWELELEPDIKVAIDEVDLAELVGNLLDNACKWGRSRLRVRIREREPLVSLHIEDDGPGVPDERLTEILARGTRLDDQKAGSGLGLAISNDIVSAYRGSMRLSRSELGGLLVQIDIPLARRMTETANTALGEGP